MAVCRRRDYRYCARRAADHRHLRVDGVEFNLTSIAAVLTIVGYSLNDTVVVYDRVRENLRRYQKMPLPELLDISINHTLSRTILTALTTMLALAALYLFGGEVIRSFTFAMLFGVAIGTYSSIYIAAPILIAFKLRSDTFQKKDKEKDAPEERGSVTGAKLMARGIEIREAHFPGKAPIDTYGNGGFRFADMSHRGSLLCLPSGIHGWDVTSPEDMAAVAFERVLAEADEIEVLLVGTGTEMVILPKPLREALRAKKIVADPMNTGAAVRTYNILLGESRAVAAALIAV
nr:protein translocase subunit SecF [Marinicella sp. W31]MDC2877497.1 protein translocase subunit SecF [Marinicella sp. W31]